MKTAVIINEQHSLFPGQIELLAGFDYELYKVPATGLTIQEQFERAEAIAQTYEAVIFVSPIPVMLAKLAMVVEARSCEKAVGMPLLQTGVALKSLFIFAKERREKKEYTVDGDNVQIASKLSDEFVLVEVTN